MRISNNSPVTAIADNLPFFALENTYVESGWGVDIGESGSSIELEIGAGEGYLEGDSLTTTEEQTQLSDGDSEYPRRDLIYVAPDETITVAEGDALEPPEDRDGNDLGAENAPVPHPDSGDSLTGIPIAHVWVPSGAENTGDMDDAYVFDLRTYVELETGDGDSDSGPQEDYITIGPTALEDDDHHDKPVICEDGDTIRVTEWGISEYSGGSKSDAPSGARVALVSPGGSTISSEETSLTRDSSGIVSESVSGSGAQHYSLRLINATGNDYDYRDSEGLMAQFRVEIE